MLNDSYLSTVLLSFSKSPHRFSCFLRSGKKEGGDETKIVAGVKRSEFFYPEKGDFQHDRKGIKQFVSAINY